MRLAMFVLSGSLLLAGCAPNRVDPKMAIATDDLVAIYNQCAGTAPDTKRIGYCLCFSGDIGRYVSTAELGSFGELPQEQRVDWVHSNPKFSFIGDECRPLLR